MKKYFLMLVLVVAVSGVKAQQKNKETIVIQTNGVCEMCEKRFMDNVPYFKGVTDCKYEASTSKLTVIYQPKKTTVEQIRQGISKLGYDADTVKADQTARAKLPACCRADKGKSSCHPNSHH
ncbi:MAG: cation transporter [Bacteroidales bacterium]|jgi:copper chaperone CopZ|nr:cation transporter [Bacteroidales bacterium]